MKMRWFSGLAALALTLGTPAAMAQAQPMKFALCYDLSKAYTFVTPQIVQAAKDYADILNAKGGLEGHPRRTTATSRSAASSATRSSSAMA